MELSGFSLVSRLPHPLHRSIMTPRARAPYILLSKSYPLTRFRETTRRKRVATRVGHDHCCCYYTTTSTTTTTSVRACVSVCVRVLASGAKIGRENSLGRAGRTKWQTVRLIIKTVPLIDYNKGFGRVPRPTAPTAAWSPKRENIFATFVKS